jgi:hypothetical protein
VETTSLKRNDVADALNGRGSPSVSSRPHVEMDEKTGTLRVNDARLVTRGRRAFCRRLVQAVAGRPGVSKTMIDLASASCRVEFVPGAADLHTMASVFADSVREASAAALDGGSHPLTGSLSPPTPSRGMSRSGRPSRPVPAASGSAIKACPAISSGFHESRRPCPGLTRSKNVRRSRGRTG